jgi:diguanylate cyclase (GGDEF)-like protein/PAS domain S-box-containing protein
VLIVDDEPVVRVLASQALAALGFDVEEAEDGEEALRRVKASPPDLVLLDVELPGMDGFTTCEAIRGVEGGEDFPILVATGHTDSATVDRTFESGATDFVSKPLDWQLLQHRIRFLMRANQAFVDLRRTLENLRDSEDRLANAQRLARVGNWEWTPGENEMLWSQEMYRIFGVEPRPEAASYDALLAAVHPADRAEVEKALRAAAREGTGWRLDHRVVLPDGEEYVIHHQAEVQPGTHGERCVRGTVQDITERRRAEERIRYLAYYDSLTGLPNRRMLQEHMRRCIEEARRNDRVVALLFVDLDRFKRINDTLGHAMGDKVLKAVAGRLIKSVRVSDYVARVRGQGVVSRLGGDEFTVVLNEIRSQEDAAHVARRILEQMRQPFSIQGQTFVLGASIGIAMAPGDGEDADTLMRNADAAMYHAKSAGRGSFRFFRESMNAKAVRSLRLESALRLAVERQEIELHYQPQIESQTGRVIGIEALARWTVDGIGEVGPGEFVPLAEDVGLIEPLGRQVLRKAFRQQRAWIDAGLPHLRMAVNVSSRQLVREGFVQGLKDALEDHRVDPTGIELEITEGVLIDEEPHVLGTLRAIRELGVRLALDDFGTGFSSLSRLFRFPIDTVKIDQSFVREIGSAHKPDAIIAGVLAMARRLDLSVVAEGVETEAQHDFLRAEGCHLLQGFRFSRAVPPAEIPDLLARFPAG